MMMILRRSSGEHWEMLEGRIYKTWEKDIKRTIRKKNDGSLRTGEMTNPPIFPNNLRIFKTVVSYYVARKGNYLETTYVEH